MWFIVKGFEGVILIYCQPTNAWIESLQLINWLEEIKRNSRENGNFLLLYVGCLLPRKEKRWENLINFYLFTQQCWHKSSGKSSRSLLCCDLYAVYNCSRRHNPNIKWNYPWQKRNVTRFLRQLVNRLTATH